MCLRSFNLPGNLGLSFFIHFSRDNPPFQCFVVKPKISTLTIHLSKVLESISAQIAATDIGFPLIEPELSIRIVTKVSLNSISFSFLKDKELNGSIIILGSFEVSNKPSSKSKLQDLFCLANNFLCNLLASLDIKFLSCNNC